MIVSSKYSNTDFISKMGILIWSLLLLMAIYYVDERTGTMDNAFQLFLMATDGRAEIMADRWPALIIRIIPLALIKLELPLLMVKLSFSLSYLLFHVIIYYAILNGFKNPKLALLLLITYLIAKSTGFYWCNSEQIQGLSLLFLFFAIFDYFSFHNKIKKYLLLIPLAIALLFYHPLMLLPFSFILIYDFLEKGSPYKNRLIWLIGFGISWLLKSKFLPNWYDTMKSENFNINLSLYSNDLLSIPSIETFISSLLPKFQFLLLASIICIIVLINFRKWIQLLFVLTISIFYLFVIFIGEPNVSNTVYTEINYYPLVVFLVYPLCQLLTKGIWSNLYFRIGLTTILLVSVLRINLSSDVFTERLEWVQTNLHQSNCPKSLFAPQDLPENVKILSWAIPYESILISRNKSLHPNLKKYSENDYQSNRFVTEFNVLDSAKVSCYYFTWPEGEYCK